MSWPRALFIYAGLVATFVLYGRLNFYRDPGSIFFDETRAFERKYSAYRAQEIEAFQSELARGSGSTQAGANTSICASFVSVRRDGYQYLPATIASAIHGLSECERRDLYINVLIAHTDSSEHPSSHLTWLQNAVNRMHGYVVPAEQLSVLKALEDEKDFSKKAVFDYVYGLEDCYNTNSPWIVMFEDDILLADGWMVKTLQGLQDIQDRFSRSQSDWLFMRLFNQDRSIGWASRKVGQNHELLISTIAVLVTLPALVWLRTRSLLARKHLDNATIGIICVLLIPTIVVLFIQAGKLSMLPPRPGVYREAFGCCSQALVFPRTQVPRVKEYLLSRGSGQIDLMLDELAVQDSLDRYALYPVQAQHIGQRSVRGTAAQEAQAIWSMLFEDQSSVRLRKSHAKLADAIYGQECHAMKMR